jgi:hypothetical protein
VARWNARATRTIDASPRCRPNELRADREPGRGEAGRQGDARVSRHRERRGVADQRAEFGGHAAEGGHARNRRRRERLRRDQHRVDRRERGMHAAGEIAPAQPDALQRDARQRMPGIEQAGEAGPVRIAPRRERRRVRDRGLDRAGRPPVGEHRTDVGKAQRDDLGAELAHRRQRVLDRAPRVGVDVVERIAFVEADPHAAQVAVGRGEVVGHRVEARGRVVRVGAGDRAEHDRRIGRAAAHRPDVIERGCELKAAVSRDPTPGRLDPGVAVRRRREPDRAAGVGAERAEAEAGRRRDARAARRRPRPVVAMERIERRRNVGVVVRERAFGQLQLAEQHRARLAQLAHDRRIECRHEVAVQRHPGRGDDAFGVAEVLDRDRHAVQLRQDLAPADHLLGAARLRQRELGGHAGIRLQCRVEALDPAQQVLGQLDRRDLARGEQPRELVDLEVVEFAVFHQPEALSVSTSAARRLSSSSSGAGFTKCSSKPASKARWRSGARP